MSQQPLETSLRNNGLNDPVAQEQMDRGSLHSHSDVEKDDASQRAGDHSGDAKPLASDIEQDDGVTRIEALYLVFGKGWGLYALWGSIGLIAYVYSLSRSTTVYYAQFATSAFGEHTVIGTIGVINAILAGVAPPFVAKLADAWSRPHALALAVLFYAVGYAMCAGAKNVSTVVAGQVIYTLGNTGITFLNSLLIADITSLQWRAFVNGAVNLPYVLNAFVAGYISSGINAYSANGWRWGYGMFSILLPVCVAPALAVLLIGDRRAKKLGALSIAASSQVKRKNAKTGQDETVQRTRWENFRYYWSRLNITGLLLMGFGFALLLTPMTLNSTAQGGYSNPSLIAMMVIGGILFICWCIWDFFFAEYPFMPKRVFNRTFIACVAVDFFYFSSSYLVEGYWPSWSYVITDWNDRDYTFVQNIVTVAMCGFAVFFGLIIRYTHRYKYIQLVGLALRTTGMGLNYLATSRPTDAVLICSRVLIGFGGAISVITSYIGAQGSVPHQDLAIATAVLNLWSSIGSSITLAVSASVWNQKVMGALNERLAPTHNATEIAEIFGSIYVARLAEPRELVKEAYLEAVKGLWLGGLIVSFGAIIAGCFASNFYLGQNHNDVEKHKIIKFRNKDEIEKEIGVAPEDLDKTRA